MLSCFDLNCRSYRNFFLVKSVIFKMRKFDLLWNNFDEVVNATSLSLCSCYVCVIVILHKLADAQFFGVDPQFFQVDAQFFAAGLL